MTEDAAQGEGDRLALDDRYEVEQVIGRGGMAVVQRVRDRRSGRRVALKRLHREPDSERQQTITALFEREYLTLAQLRHPCVVEAFDYGVDAQGPYYTMELLSGGDLQTLSPMPWKRACTIARDICSALALVHSRRLVYRDLSPRNVRCTSDGSAKLIDFGAMTPMGPSRELVGTMPFMAPEALNLQPLDARTDLYALGATLYFTLVQRHAYPARDMAQLRDLWRSRPRRPSELVADIPAALDDLVMDLLQLDPAARPASAFEVIARLNALAGLRSSEQMLVPQAYLLQPTLVGRSELVLDARKAMLSALRMRGESIMACGAEGAGRSRLLDAQVLEAKLAGLTVLRADAADARRGAYGVARALFEQLAASCGPSVLSSDPEAAALLGLTLPELRASLPDAELRGGSSEASVTTPARVQQTLRKTLLAASRGRALLLAVDDVPRIDEQSAGLLALLAQEVGGHGLVIATTCADEDLAGSPARAAVELLASSSQLVRVENLSASSTEELLSTVFGDVPNLPLLARYVHAVSGGNPRDIMRLAQHLVSDHQVCYQAGAWFIPAHFDPSSLPASMGDALRMRAASLSSPARGLALCFALEPKQTFSFDDCAALAASASEQTTASLLQALNELVAAEVLSNSGDSYTLRQTSWRGALEEASSEPQRTAAHLRLAGIFEARGDGFRAAEHLLSGGRLERGLDVLLEQAIASEQMSDADASAFYQQLGALPPHWLSVYERGLALCTELGRPASQRDALLSRLCGLVAFAVSETDGYAYIAARIERLRRESGLEDFASLPSSLDFGTRLRTALGMAGARFQATAESERVGDPGWAIKQIVKSTLAALGTITFTLDYQACRRLPSLAPLIALSPAVEVVEKLVAGLGARLVGRVEAAIAIYHGLLERLGQPDRAGLTEVHHMTTRVRIVQGLGMLDAAMGRKSCLDYAAQVECEPIYALQGMFLRHIYLVWLGDAEEADRYKRQIDIARIESSARFGFEGQHLLSELVAYALADDITRVKRATEAVEPRARVHGAWEPVLSFGRGEYHRIRGDYASALAEHERGLSLISRGEHQIWIYTAGAHVRTLSALGQHVQACERGREYLQTALENGVGYLQSHIRIPLSRALAAAGAHDEAIALADSVIGELKQLQAGGLLLACAYEARAYVARASGDEEGCDRYATLGAEQCPAGAMRLRAARLQRSARNQNEEELALLDELSVASQFASVIENCQTLLQRASVGIAYLVSQSGAIGGVLYTNMRGGLVRTAVFGEADPDASDADAIATAYFHRELDVGEATGAFSMPPSVAPSDAPSDAPTDAHVVTKSPHFVRVLLTHQSERRTMVTGVALLLSAGASSFRYPMRIANELSQSLAAENGVQLVQL